MYVPPVYLFSVFISFCIFIPSPCVHLLLVYLLLYFSSFSLWTSAPRLCPSVCLFLRIFVFIGICLTGCESCHEYVFASVCIVYTLHHVYIPPCVHSIGFIFHLVYLAVYTVYRVYNLPYAWNLALSKEYTFFSRDYLVFNLALFFLFWPSSGNDQKPHTTIIFPKITSSSLMQWVGEKIFSYNNGLS